MGRKDAAKGEGVSKPLSLQKGILHDFKNISRVDTL